MTVSLCDTVCRGGLVIHSLHAVDSVHYAAENVFIEGFIYLPLHDV